MNITPRDIVDRLKTDMDAVCKYLLPGGKRSGSEWEVGSTAGEAGKSLKIHLNGDKAGVWSDFATSQSGDVLDLWCAVRGIDLGQAIREAKSYLGITDPAWEGHKPRQYTRPERPKKARKPTSAVTEYFSGRGITEATLKAFRIAEEPGAAHFSRLKDNPATIVFPFLRDDELIAVKYLAIQRIDGKKQTLVEKGCEPCLFGWQALPSGVRNVALTEGECFPGNAEVLTEDGWVCLDRYNGGRVAQVNVDGSSEWVYPLARIDKPYDGHLLERQCRGYYSLTTPGHKLIAIDSKGRWYTHTAEQGAKARAHLIPRVTALDGQGIPLTDDQLRLAIAVSADGSIDIRKCAYGNKPARNIPIERRYVRFGFKKIRKIQRLREVLTACGIESSDTAIGNGYRSICFSLPDWVPGRLFPREWIGLATLAQRRLILDEMVYWDGNQVQNRAQTEYSTKWIENAIFIQTMAHTSGFCSTVMRRSNTFGEWFKVSVLTEKKTTSWQCLKENRIRYEGRVYCLQVPSGMLLVRQNGKITVSGNCDAMTLQQFGIAALSVPMGAGNHQWIEYEYERLERFDQIFLCFDQDSAGQKAVGELVERLGRHRCRIVKLGHKDANECLQRGWGVKEFADAFMAAKTMDPQALRSAADYVDEVVAEFYPPPDRSPGLRTPWQKVGENLLFRAAEVSLWTGYNGHGKSQALNFVMANAMACGARVCIASMELPPRRLLYRLTKQLCGTAEPSIPYIRAAHRWLEDRLWLFDAVGTVKAAHILEVFAYARQRYRVTHFVLDSLSKCGLAEDDYNGQKALVEGLCDFAHAHNVHVYLVAHARKGHDERGRPGKMDVKGTGALTDMVDTVITVWRNKAKEEGLEEARINGEEVTEEFLSKPDGSITVSKQRNGSWEGTIALWFDPDALQYHGAPGYHAIQYVDYSAQSDTRKRYAEDDL